MRGKLIKEKVGIEYVVIDDKKDSTVFEFLGKILRVSQSVNFLIKISASKFNFLLFN